jgi:hypothetical protein
MLTTDCGTRSRALSHNSGRTQVGIGEVAGGTTEGKNLGAKGLGGEN